MQAFALHQNGGRFHQKIFHYVSFAKQIAFPLSFVLFLLAVEAISIEMN